MCLLLTLVVAVRAQSESPYLYGIHDHEPNPQEYLNHFTNGGTTGWVTATVAIGSNPTDTGGTDFRGISNQGHTVIARLNNGYCPNGTIPVPSKYADFAQRCANYVAATQGCDIFIIGNETNLAQEWPLVNNRLTYVSPQSYADCFVQCYNKIKLVRPQAKILSQALAPWAGPYQTGSTCGFSHDAMPMNWVTYLNQMLTAIKNAGAGPDGIALHINSRGYTYNDIHSNHTVNVQGQVLNFSFYVYKDWINFGIPQSLWHLPLYATECNGNYFWKGGHAECTDANNPSCKHQPGWMQEIYAEINRWNTQQGPLGKPVFRCVNMYRWCGGCDGWNIDGSPVKGQMLADLDGAVSQKYRWDGVTGGDGTTNDPPSGVNLSPLSTQVQTSSALNAQSTGAFAIDDVVSAGSKWTTQNVPPPHWLALDLGDTRTVNGYKIHLPGAAGELTAFNAEAMTIQSGPGINGPWSNETVINNSTQANVINKSYMTPKSLRYVRLLVTDAGTDNYARIPEFQVFGPAPPPVGYQGDFDGDDDVDQADFGHFQRCLTGPGIAQSDPLCTKAKLDADSDVDQDDFGIFQACMSGPNETPNGACLQ